MRIEDTGYARYTYSQIKGNKGPAQLKASAKSGKDTSMLSAWAPEHTDRTDKVELNCRSAQLDTFLASLKESLCEEINSDAEPFRLKELKNAVENGSYSLDSGALAETLLFDK
ncbi:MAG: hypothetical protein ACFWUC_01555 [Oscillospiraceae bacterium]|jgi:anti-sigma28 factor (negative regulator of flagellin synthesis)